MIAARAGNSKEVQRLIENGAEIDRQSRYGWTALMFAAWQGHAKCVRVLLDAGANPNIKSGEIPSAFETVSGYPSSTALEEAVSHDHTEIAKILVKAKARIAPIAVALAARQGNLELLKFFKAEGIDVTQPSGNAFYPSPLIAASQKGHLAAVMWLVEQGADPNQIVDGDNATKDAIESDKHEVVRYLLEKGADPNLVCGSTPGTQEGLLFSAVTKVTHDHAYTDNIAIVRMLLEHGADTNQQGFSGEYTTFEFLRRKIESGEEGLREATTEEERKREQESLDHLNSVYKILKQYADKKAN